MPYLEFCVSMQSRLQPKQKTFSICVENHSSDDWTLSKVVFPFSSFLILFIVELTSSKLLILSRGPRHRGQKGYCLSVWSCFYNLPVSRITVGTVFTLYPACILLKKPSVRRSVLPKNGGCFVTWPLIWARDRWAIIWRLFLWLKMAISFCRNSFIGLQNDTRPPKFLSSKKATSL